MPAHAGANFRGEVLNARFADVGHLEVISNPVASKLVHKYLASLEYEIVLPWGFAKASKFPHMKTPGVVSL